MKALCAGITGAVLILSSAILTDLYPCANHTACALAILGVVVMLSAFMAAFDL